MYALSILFDKMLFTVVVCGDHGFKRAAKVWSKEWGVGKDEFSLKIVMNWCIYWQGEENPQFILQTSVKDKNAAGRSSDGLNFILMMEGSKPQSITCCQGNKQ